MEKLFPLLMLGLLVTMFLGFRRQKKAAAKTAELQNSLSVGDRVLTTSGLQATVVEIGDGTGTVGLEIAPGVITTWSRLVVRELITEDDDTDLGFDDLDQDDADGAEHVTEETAEETERRLDKQ